MYHPTTRLLTILELLQSRQAISGTELAERLEVDTRTVRRYITMLQDMGIPIEAERGRQGGYQLRPGFKLPPLMFTEDEAVALTLGLLVTRQLGMGIDAAAVEGALAKVERVLPTSDRELVHALQDALTLELPTNPVRQPAGQVVKWLSLAVQKQQQVQLDYQSWNSTTSTRVLDPYGLAYRTGYWYLVGYCHLRKAIRTFRLDRVQQVDLLDQSFTRPPDLNILSYVERAIAQTPGAWRIDVLLQTNLADAQQLIPPALATLEPTDAGVALRCYVQRLGWFAHFLAGLPCPFVVRHPPELRVELQSLVAKITQALQERTASASDIDR